MKILVSVLTFNRLDLLKRCIKNLNELTYKNFDLLIVDNGSTDGTQNYLIDNNYIYILNESSGSALGWYKCINYALENDYDFIWMMDDDGYPKNNALEILINNLELKDNNTICLSSILVSEKNFNDLVFELPKFKNNFNFFFRSNYKKLNEIKTPLINHVHLFNGSLLKIKLLKKIGNVDTDFFHHGVEVDYHYKLSQKYNLYTVTDAVHYHPEVKFRVIGKMWVYYYLKNSIINNFKYSKFPILKSLVHIFLCVLRIYKRNGLLDMFSYLIGRKSNIFYLAIFDGFKNKMIKRMF